MTQEDICAPSPLPLSTCPYNTPPGQTRACAWPRRQRRPPAGPAHCSSRTARLLPSTRPGLAPRRGPGAGCVLRRVRRQAPVRRCAWLGPGCDLRPRRQGRPKKQQYNKTLVYIEIGTSSPLKSELVLATRPPTHLEYETHLCRLLCADNFACIIR
jgi:hypothetical protein